MLRTAEAAIADRLAGIPEACGVADFQNPSQGSDLANPGNTLQTFDPLSNEWVLPQGFNQLLLNGREESQVAAAQEQQLLYRVGHVFYPLQQLMEILLSMQASLVLRQPQPP